MQHRFILLLFLLLNAPSWAQVKNERGINESVPIAINWVEHLEGDFSFIKNWSYPLGVELKEDGKAGCADGGFCPQRCYGMMDENGIVLKDSAKLFYQLLDTTHLNHSIECTAWCYEWAGTDFIEVIRENKNNVSCFTATDVATHCSLELLIQNNTCFASILLQSVMPNSDATFYCTEGFISIDKKLWKKGILKAQFSFNFKNTSEPEKPFYWKGKIYSKIYKV